MMLTLGDLKKIDLPDDTPVVLACEDITKWDYRRIERIRERTVYRGKYHENLFQDVAYRSDPENMTSSCFVVVLLE